jgi:hypothetical protein
MADQNKIKEILRKRVRPGKYVSEQQLAEIASQIITRRLTDLNEVRALSTAATKDPGAIVVEAVDMGDIKNELEKDPPPKAR